jgi:PAS domain S-box-containing protein
MFASFRRIYRRSLALKLLVPLTTVAASLMTIGCVLMLYRLTYQMELLLERRSEGFARSIDLLTGIPATSSQMRSALARLSQDEGLISLRIVDVESGRVIHASGAALESRSSGALADERALLDSLQDSGKTSAFQRPGDHRFIGAFRSWANPSQAMLITLDSRAEEADRAKIVFRRLTTICVTMIAITVLNYRLLYRLVLRPSSSMREAILNHAQGDFAGRPIVHSCDELGLIADSLDRLFTSLSDRESHLSAMLESSLDCIITIDAQGRILEFNPAAERTFGYQRHKVVGRQIAEMVIPESLRERHRKGLARFLSTGESTVLGRRVEVNAQRSNGEEFPVELAIMPVRTTDPPVFTAFLRDITIRRRAQEALRESEQRFRMLADSAPVLIWMCDEQQIFNYFNKGWLNFTGRTAAHETGKGWQVGVHLDDYQRLQQTFFSAIRSRQPFQTEFRLRRHDGQYRWMNSVGVPRFTADGAFAGLIGTCTDVTERILAQQDLEKSFFEVAVAREQMEDQTHLMRQKNDELQDAREAAEAAARSKTEFLANMSHEIRTPMTAILGFADVLMGEEGLEPSAEERRAAYETIKRNGQYLLTLINDILDLSKIEIGKLAVEFLPCCPQGIVREVVELLGHRAASKGLQLTLHSEEGLPDDMLSDPTRLRQILVNLIGNAVKFTQAGRVDVRLRRIVESHSVSLLCEISDTGIGMDEDQLTRLFAPFTQADMSTTRQFGGTGLGLTISRHLARLLGGDISVISRPGSGSTFTLRLPLTEAPDLPPQMPEIVSDDRSVAEEPLRLTGSKLLLAEDGIDNQRLLSYVLRAAGAEVIVVENGKLALEVALADRDRGEDFDLILMDMQMPVMDGYSASIALRRSGVECPIIALTAHAMASDRQKCLDAGCTDYASKPIDRKSLVKLVASHLAAGNCQSSSAVTTV